MSVAEIKAQTESLSFEELSDLARHIRALTLRKDPVRRGQLRSAQESKDWITRAEFEQTLVELDRSGQ